ncbi:MAG: hypothetical protein ABW352_12145 [Polyangiales bacterium]
MHSKYLYGGIVLLTAGVAYATVDSIDAGWQPMVSLFGAGERSDALTAIRAVNHASAVAIHNTKRDPSVQEFIDGTIEDLSDFNLGDFHQRLPNQNGEYRELWVKGELQGDTYRVTQAKDKKGYAVSLKGERNKLGDMSLTIRSKPSKGAGDKNAYFLGVRTGLGVGDIRWGSVMSAVQDYARIATQVNPTAGAKEPAVASSEARAKAKALHPKLGAEDLDVLGLMFEAYPNLAPELSKLGTVEDVRTVSTGRGYQQLTALMKGSPERFGKSYPAFAKYLDNMDDIATFEIKWLDKQGRNLTTTKIDSERLTFQFSCYVKDGYLLPFKGVKVFEDEPVDPLASSITSTKVIVDARIKLLGLVIKMKELSLDLFYQPNQYNTDIGLTFTKVPPVKVEGAALGFVPTALVDAMIPGNMESLTRDFLTVAAKGNGGKGFTLAGKIGVPGEGSKNGVLEMGVDVDALDNFLIKIGVGMVNDRLMPKPNALDEIKAYSGAVQSAFAKDFKGFEKHGATAAK